MKRSIVGVLICPWILVGLMFGCSKQSTEVSGSEIGNPTIAGTLLDSSDMPIVDAQIALYKAGGSEPLLLQQSDAEGLFEVENIDSGSYHVEVLSKDSLLIGYYSDVAYDSLLGLLQLQRPARIQGTVFIDDISSVSIAGTHYKATLNSDGMYAFNLLPIGMFDIVATHLNETGVAVDTVIETVDLQPDEDLDLVPGSSSEYIESSASSSSEPVVDELVLLDDFADRDHYHAQGSILEEGYWYMLYDSADGGASTVVPFESYGDAFTNATQEYDGAGNGYSLKVLFDLDESFGDPYAGVIVSLGSQSADLSEMDSLVFDFKGDGDITVEIEREVWDEFNNSELMRASWYFANNVDWVKRSLKVSDLFIDPNYHPEGLGIADLLRNTYRITFKATSGTWLQIGDVHLGGVTKEDIVPYVPL
ncbi:MAG: carboxypeptidase-like regulatory domain-containing protein [Fibrobacterales bacterium]